MCQSGRAVAGASTGVELAPRDSEARTGEAALMLVVLVHVTVRSELLAEFERAILANAHGARTREQGCVRFEVNQSEDDPAQWMFYEVYKDGAAFEAHRASAHFAAYQQVADRALVSKTLTRWTSKG